MQGMACETTGVARNHASNDRSSRTKSSRSSTSSHSSQKHNSKRRLPKQEIESKKPPKKLDPVLIEPLPRTVDDKKPIIVVRPASGNSENDHQVEGKNHLRIPSLNPAKNDTDHFISYSTPVSRRGSSSSEQLLPPDHSGASSSREKSPVKSCLAREGSTKFSSKDLSAPSTMRRSRSVSFHPDTDFGENRHIRTSRQKSASQMDVSSKKTKRHSKQHDLDEQTLKILERQSKMSQVLEATKKCFGSFKCMFHHGNDEAVNGKPEAKNSKVRHNRRHSASDQVKTKRRGLNEEK